jgi:hypothetical protein
MTPNLGRSERRDIVVAIDGPRRRRRGYWNVR